MDEIIKSEHEEEIQETLSSIDSDIITVADTTDVPSQLYITDSSDTSVIESISCKCKDCGNIFQTKDNMQSHRESQHLDTRFMCEECEFQTKHRRSLRKHKASKHLNIKFSCNECD